MNERVPEVHLHQALNTLFVQAQGAYLRADHETFVVEVDGKKVLQVPGHHLGCIVVFGNVLVSPGVIERCANEGRALVFFDHHGKFRARLEGPCSGNVLLRVAQHRALQDPEKTLMLARNIVAGKVQNARQVLMRGARQYGGEEAQALRESAEVHASVLRRLERARSLDEVRGLEGEAGEAYFRAFGRLVREDPEFFRFSGRSRRPPRDPLNALLSFLYALLLVDCVSALEGVGLDPQVGFLHALRPGRPALGLDLMEEFRPVLGDRLALTLVNRRQVTRAHFVERPGGAVHLTEEGRREVIVAYQRRKQERVTHPLLDRTLPLGLMPHIQARLLARTLRGDMETYIPFLVR